MSTATQLTAADIMQSDVHTVSPTATLHDACRSMLSHHISGLPVVDVHNRCIGVLTSTDIVNFLESRCESGPRRRHRFDRYFDEAAQRWEYALLADDPPNELDEHEVAEAMTRPVVFVGPDATLQQVAARMRREHCHRMLVLSEGHYLQGIITSFDFVALIAEDDALTHRR